LSIDGCGAQEKAPVAVDHPEAKQQEPP